MSGHSKWSKIKRKKGANDMKKGALFTKLAKAITMAASEGGGDQSMNFSLRLAVESAKKANMPLINIDRAIKKGTGESGETIQIRKMVYEGVVKGGVAIVVVCSTDNTNRTVSDVRKAFDEVGGNLGTTGSQIWQFEEKGIIELRSAKLKKAEKYGADDIFVAVDTSDAEMEIIDVNGVEDLEMGDEKEIIVYTKKENFAQVHKKIEEIGYEIIDAGIRYVCKEAITVDKQVEEKVLRIMEVLEELDDVDDVYTNIKFSD